MKIDGLSIVIPAYNEERALPETLASIHEARQQFEYAFHKSSEVIVVDNASTDSTAKTALGLCASVVRHEIRNIASVRNAGIKAAKYDLVATVDADTIVPADAFVKIAEAMKTGRWIGGGVRLRLRTSKPHLRLIAETAEPLVVLLSGVSGGMFFFGKEDALAMGGFPEKMAIAEDLTFAKLLRAHGAKSNRPFLNLRTVTIQTMDRKDVSFGKTMSSLWAGAKAFCGIAPSRKDLAYWYDSDR